MRRPSSLLPVLLLCAASAPAAEVCGYVYSVRGDWRLAPQFAVSLKPGMELHTGDKVKLMTAARPAHINAGLLNGALWKQECSTEAECRDPLALPGAAPAASLPERLRTLIASFGSHPAPVVFTLSRGGEDEPAEAVLRLRAGQADLAPALRSLAARVTVRLFPLAEGAPSAEIACAPSAPCQLAALAPGLYRLEARTADREPQSVLVLLAPEAGYARCRDTFADALRVADAWGNAAHADARHYFLSATLEALSRPAGKTR